MLRYFVFFADKLPAELHIHSSDATLTALDKSTRDFLQQCPRLPVQMKTALNGAPHLSACFVRNSVSEEDESLEQAHAQVAALLDTYALIAFETPKLLPVVIICDDGSHHAKVGLFEIEGPGNVFIGEAAAKFQKRSAFLLQRLLPAFDLIESNAAENELAERLRVFARMFHLGRIAHQRQVQFLCKFTAVESLVCGSQERGRGPKLRERLPSLFKGRLTSERVKELWELRCGASHEGSGEWTSFVNALADIDYLALGCAIFAVDHLGLITSLDDLWKKASKYHLPSDLFVDAISFAAQKAFNPLATFDAKIFKWAEIFAKVNAQSGS